MDEIAVVEYDPRWPALFAAEAARVRAALGGDVAVVEHFGSTAVPGLAAKPIIDILVGVRSLAGARERLVAPLESLGYAYWRDNPNPDRLFFVRGLPPDGPRTHHVHVVEFVLEAAPDAREPGSLFQESLLFRDHLRRHPDEARRYAALKRALAARFTEDREGYTAAKSEYVQAVTRLAREAASPF